VARPRAGRPNPVRDRALGYAGKNWTVQSIEGSDLMATQKQRQAARKNVKKAQAGARKKKTITKLSRRTRSALGREGAKAAARKRGASKGTGSGAGAMTVTELRREAARLGIEGRSKMGKAQLIRAVGQKRRSRS
jgi:Rho termination factor, N-terminal domain